MKPSVRPWTSMTLTSKPSHCVVMTTILTQTLLAAALYVLERCYITILFSLNSTVPILTLCLVCVQFTIGPYQFLTQNPNKKGSKNAELAKAGSKLTWIINYKVCVRAVFACVSFPNNPHLQSAYAILCYLTRLMPTHRYDAQLGIDPGRTNRQKIKPD